MRSLQSLLLVVTVLCPALACAHKQSDSYLTLLLDERRPMIQGQWDIALRDLDFIIGLDANADDAITWGEVKARSNAIAAYALQRLRLQSVTPSIRNECPTQMHELLIDEHVDGVYAVVRFSAECSTAPEQLAIDYGLFFAVDPNHRGLVLVRSDHFDQTVALSTHKHSVVLNTRVKDAPAQVRSFISEGIAHIWDGYDHVAFLLTLLLPAVVVRQSGSWQGRTSLRESFSDVLKVVTSFTVAHSITLSLAAVGVIQLPSRIVETAIAVSVLLGALNILYPIVHKRRWAIALLFGLVHGLGFASVLADLGLPSNGLVLALLGFNVGVELGQVAIVAAVMPAIYLCRDTAFYRLFLSASAAAISCLAIYWIGLRLTS